MDDAPADGSTRLFIVYGLLFAVGLAVVLAISNGEMTLPVIIGALVGGALFGAFMALAGRKRRTQ